MIAEKRKQSALPSGCPSGRQIFNHQNLLDNALSPQETASSNYALISEPVLPISRQLFTRSSRQCG